MGPATTPHDGVVVVIPAFDEAERIGETVESAASILVTRAVIVVDDGSRDDTAARARAAGAHVVAHPRRRGKAAALMTGADVAAATPWRDAPLLLLDADLRGTARGAEPLTVPVLAGQADLTIGLLPRAPGAGGHGFVVRLAGRGIEKRSGWRPEQPLSGQRCVTRSLFDAVRPLARGFGVEVAMTIDALARGARVRELPVDVGHRVTGTSLRDQLHRARQYRDVWLALRRPPRRGG